MQRFLRISAVTALALITFLYPLGAPPRHRIDERHFKLIRPGMTEAEVEAIFGAPAGVYDWVMVVEGPIPNRCRVDPSFVWTGSDSHAI
jgi:hypothetical protein